MRGPYGLGLKSVALPDEDAGDGLIVSGALPLALIQRSFTLSRAHGRDEHESTSLDLAPLAEAAIAVARREDEVVFAARSARRA